VPARTVFSGSSSVCAYSQVLLLAPFTKALKSLQNEQPELHVTEVEYFQEQFTFLFSFFQIIQ
jgi:hypothetical protein